MNLKTVDAMSVARQVINNNLTLVKEPLFTCLYDLAPRLKEVDGDVVEAGVWQGGYSIFLAHLFPYKKIWLCDSFDGFQPVEQSKYRAANPADEVHNPSYAGWIKVDIDTVKENLTKFNLSEGHRIKFLKGWVKDTLDKETCPIEKVAILRIDVDAYGATYEVLENMYEKVTSGGVIIFDDYSIKESKEATHDFFNNNNIDIPDLIVPSEQYKVGLPNDKYNGAYMFKP